MTARTTYPIPAAFIWRRVHSLMGLWLVVFLCEHLFVNSQAALWFGEDGKRFVALANLLQSIPALQVVECLLIGVPVLVHTIWGIRRVYLAKTNSWITDGTTPSLPQFGRNWAFTWQRLSSWILVVGVIAHVVQVRWIADPRKAYIDHQEVAMVRVSFDEGLFSVADRLHVQLFSHRQIAGMAEDGGFSKALKQFSLKENELVAVAKDRGTAILLTVRDTFKSPWMCALYSIFVLAAVFHALNGFWTFLLTWGLILSVSSQKAFQKLGWVGMVILSALGFAAIWMTFWMNLRQ